MSNETEKLIEAAREIPSTPESRELHRKSFAYGNTKIENARVTKELVDREADNLKREQNGK